MDNQQDQQSAPTPAVPDPPKDQPSAADVELQRKCDDEFERYDKVRADVVEAERKAETNYDTLLVTLSTLAIGTSFTVLKDVVKASGSSALLIWSWVALGVCLILALSDRLLTYWTHMRWRELLDAEFGAGDAPWREGAWDRALKKYDEMRLIKVLPWLKWFGFGSLLIGLVFLMAFVFSGREGAPTTDAAPVAAMAQSPQAPVIVNNYNMIAPATPSAQAIQEPNKLDSNAVGAAMSNTSQPNTVWTTSEQRSGPIPPAATKPTTVSSSTKPTPPSTGKK